MNVQLIPCSVIQLAFTWDGKAALWAAFSHLRGMAVSDNSSFPISVAVYIDGDNLYYGRLRGTPFKWLDIVQFFDALMARRDQHEAIEKVVYFTAPALATFATHGAASVEAQSSYHRALQAIHGERLEIIYGSHSYDRGGAELPRFIEGRPYNRRDRVKVWKLEEKKTDVNIAIRMYRDACRGKYRRIILVSNDSDAEPALAAIREDFNEMMIGIVSPVRPPQPGVPHLRRTSGSLVKFADWTVPYLLDEHLASAQLPHLVATKKKPIRKPRHWGANAS
ncbi:NYN domain-containing protein [Duganella sp. PWIR1]